MLGIVLNFLDPAVGDFAVTVGFLIVSNRSSFWFLHSCVSFERALRVSRKAG